MKVTTYTSVEEAEAALPLWQQKLDMLMAANDHEACLKMRVRPAENTGEYEMVVYCAACTQHFVASSEDQGGLAKNLRHLTTHSHKVCLDNALNDGICLDCRSTNEHAPSVREEIKHFVSTHHTDFEMSPCALFGSELQPKALCKHCTKSNKPRSFDIVLSAIKDMKAHMLTAGHVMKRNAKH